MKFTGIAAAAIAATLVTGAASAATLSLVGTFGTDDAVSGNDFGHNGTLDFISGDLKDDENGLYLSGPATVTYTYIGKEAGNTNYASADDVEFFTTASIAGATHVVTQLAAGLLEFSLGTIGTGKCDWVIANNGFALPASSRLRNRVQEAVPTHRSSCCLTISLPVIVTLTTW